MSATEESVAGACQTLGDAVRIAARAAISIRGWRFVDEHGVAASLIEHTDGRRLWWSGLDEFDPVVEPELGAWVRWYEGNTPRVGEVVARGPGFVRARHVLHRSGASQVDSVMNDRYVEIDPRTHAAVKR